MIFNSSTYFQHTALSGVALALLEQSSEEIIGESVPGDYLKPSSHDDEYRKSGLNGTYWINGLSGRVPFPQPIRRTIDV